MNGTRSTRGDDLAADRLTGCAQIARFWFGNDGHLAVRATFRLLEKRVIPAGKLGGQWIASRRALRERHERLTSGEAAD
jgi:hypothetical protein